MPTVSLFKDGVFIATMTFVGFMEKTIETGVEFFDTFDYTLVYCDGKYTAASKEVFLVTAYIALSQR